MDSKRGGDFTLLPIALTPCHIRIYAKCPESPSQSGTPGRPARPALCWQGALVVGSLTGGPRGGTRSVWIGRGIVTTRAALITDTTEPTPPTRPTPPVGRVALFVMIVAMQPRIQIIQATLVARVLTIPLVVTITRVVSSGSNQGPIMRAVRDTLIVGLMPHVMAVRVLPAARVLGTLSTLPSVAKKPGLPIESDALVVGLVEKMSNAASVLIATVAGLLLVTTRTSRTIRIHNATRMIGTFDRTITGSRNRITSTEVKNVPSGRTS